MIIVDPSVVSELLHPTWAPPVERWLAAQVGFHICRTAISEAELPCGVAIMDSSKRPDGLADALDRILRDDLEGRVLALDSAAPETYAIIAASRRAVRRPSTPAHCQLAATARSWFRRCRERQHRRLRRLRCRSNQPLGLGVVIRLYSESGIV